MAESNGEYVAPLWSPRCRTYIARGRWKGLRCWRFRWHRGPHQGEDIHGPTWEQSGRNDPS